MLRLLELLAELNHLALLVSEDCLEDVKLVPVFLKLHHSLKSKRGDKA